MSLEIDYFTRNEAQEQHSLLDTMFDDIFYFEPPGTYLYLSPQNPLHVGRRTGQHVVGFLFLLLICSWRSRIKNIVNYCTCI